MSSSDNEIDTMYMEIIGKLRTEAKEISDKADEINTRSLLLDSHIAALREENLREMAKTENRLAVLQQAPIAPPLFDVLAENDTWDMAINSDALKNVSAEFNEKYKLAADFTAKISIDPESDTKISAVSAKTKAITDQIISLLDGRGIAKEEPKTLPKKTIRAVSTLIPSFSAEIVPSSESEGDEDDDDDDEDIPPPPPPKAQPIQSDIQIPPAPELTPPSMSTVASPSFQSTKRYNSGKVQYKRCYDYAHKAHYYVDVRTGVSQWMPPTEGVVECCLGDDSTVPLSGGLKIFYTDVKTGKSTWAT